MIPTKKRIYVITSSKVSKADAAVANIPGTVGVPQKDVTENPEIYTHVSFVPRIVIGGQLTTSEFLKPGRSRKALSRVVGYGPEVKRLWRNLDLPPSNINRDGNIEVTRNCDRGIKRCGG